MFRVMLFLARATVGFFGDEIMVIAINQCRAARMAMEDVQLIVGMPDEEGDEGDTEAIGFPSDSK